MKTAYPNEVVIGNIRISLLLFFGIPNILWFACIKCLSFTLLLRINVGQYFSSFLSVSAGSLKHGYHCIWAKKKDCACPV